MKQQAYRQQTEPLKLGEIIIRDQAVSKFLIEVDYKVNEIDCRSLVEFTNYPTILKAINYSKKYKLITMFDGKGNIHPLGKYVVGLRNGGINALFYVNDSNIQLLGIDSIAQVNRINYAPYMFQTELLKLKIDNTTTNTMNITAQNYATETAKLDLNSLTQEQQNFHALVLPHIVRFDKEISNDKNKEAQTKLSSYYNLLSVKLQGKASPQDDEKAKLFQFRKRKQLQLALAAKARK